MSELLDALSQPGAMTDAQWLVLAIAGFIVLGSLYFIWKLFHLLKTSGKSTYKPNIGASRTGYKHPRKETPKVDAAAVESDLKAE